MPARALTVRCVSSISGAVVVPEVELGEIAV
jgi:hypothetical protein